jgi:hypothetical protein
MPRACTICSHESRDEIEDAFIAGQAKRRIAAQHGVTEQALRRHLREHLPTLLALARDAERAARADTLLDRIEALQSRTEEALAKAESSDNLFATFRGISEMRHNLELIGEITKELNRTPTLNLSVNPEWVELRTVIVGALEPHPEARDSVLRAIRSAGNGNG